MVAPHVTVMIRIISLLFLFLVSCGSEFVVTPKKVVEVTVADTSPTTEVIVDYFEQPSKPESLDVLIVLDTSCSMIDDYEKVSIGMDLLRDEIEPLTEDYQMGIINSSLAEDATGLYFIGPFDKDTSSIDFLLAPSLLASDFFEKAYAAHYQFATMTEEGALFLRPGVDKLIIYISDEEEQSPLPVNVFKEWLDTYHEGVQHDVIAIAVIEDSSSECAWGEHSFRYQSLLDYYNKMVIDFCGDWQLALADSSFLLRSIDYLRLSRIPIEESIVVYRDGEKQDMWYYLSTTNTVYFEFDMPEGAVIKVGYDSLVQ